jgi:hypothetical protein
MFSAGVLKNNSANPRQFLKLKKSPIEPLKKNQKSLMSDMF